MPIHSSQHYELINLSVLALEHVVLIGLFMSQIPYIYALSNSSLLFDASHLEPDNVLSIQKKIWALTAHCKQSSDFADVVPAMNSLTLYLKNAENLNKWQKSLLGIWGDTKNASFKSQHHKINTVYNGEDIAYVAKYNNLTTEDVISIHSKTHYHVLFLGFQPGFAYLHGLDERLQTPRRSEPRTKVPKGSVAIGADKTAIYPADTPGGWHIIGHTNTLLFDHTLQTPCLINPGDTLEFVPCSLSEAIKHD